MTYTEYLKICDLITKTTKVELIANSIERDTHSSPKARQVETINSKNLKDLIKKIYLESMERTLMKLTKRQMIEEMIDGLKFINTEEVIKNRLKNKLGRIKQVYKYYKENTKQTQEDKLYCIDILVVW